MHNVNCVRSRCVSDLQSQFNTINICLQLYGLIWGKTWEIQFRKPSKCLAADLKPYLNYLNSCPVRRTECLRRTASLGCLGKFDSSWNPKLQREAQMKKKRGRRGSELPQTSKRVFGQIWKKG